MDCTWAGLEELTMSNACRWLLGLPTSESRQKYPDHSDFLNKR